MQSVIAVPHQVFENLHLRFDNGETQVYTGTQNGTNRRIFRRDDRSLYAADGRQVYDLDVIIQQAKYALPVSQFGTELLKK